MAIVPVYFILCQPLPLCLQATPWHVGCLPGKEGGRSFGGCWEQSRGAVSRPIKQKISAQQPAGLAARQVSTETTLCTDLVFPAKDQHALIQTKIKKLHLGYWSFSRGQLWLREAGEKNLLAEVILRLSSHKWQHQKEMKLHSRMNKCAESETCTSGSSITYHPFIVWDEMSSTNFKLPSADALLTSVSTHGRNLILKNKILPSTYPFGNSLSEQHGTANLSCLMSAN